MPTNKMESLRKKLELYPGEHIIFHNSKTPVTYADMRKVIPEGVDFTICRRNFWEDISDFKCIHISIVILTCGIGSLGYLGFWLYERWKPLYIINIRVCKKEFTNPFFDV